MNQQARALEEQFPDEPDVVKTMEEGDFLKVTENWSTA